MLSNREHGQSRKLVALSSAENAFAVTPQDLEVAISTSAEPRGWVHLRDPPSGRWPPHLERAARKGLKVYHSRSGIATSVALKVFGNATGRRASPGAMGRRCCAICSSATRTAGAV